MGESTSRMTLTICPTKQSNGGTGYREFVPAPALQKYIECYWVHDGALPSAPRRVLPDGCIDIMACFAPDGNVALFAVGTMTQALYVEGGMSSYLGIRFLSGEAFSFLNIRADEITDKMVPLTDIGFRFEHEMLIENYSIESKINALDRFFLRQLSLCRRSDHRLRYAIQQILTHNGEKQTKVIASGVGLSPRTLERLFAERVGLGPKSLSKIARLKSVVKTLEQEILQARHQHRKLNSYTKRKSPNHWVDWGKLAVDHGYADQAHLVRDFGALTGVSPGVWVSERMSLLFNTAESTGAMVGSLTKQTQNTNTECWVDQQALRQTNTTSANNARTTMSIVPDMIGIITHDINQSLKFYSLLGLNVPSVNAGEDYAQVITPNGYRISWNTVSLVKQMNPDWVEPVGHRIELAFKCDSPSEVNTTYEKIITSGYKGHKEPWDAFWGQRYAVVVDPDGNHISIFAALA